MVAIKAVRAANSAYAATGQSPIAVFTGATGGIGLATIEALLRSTKSPRIYIVGRSESKFAPKLSQLRQLNTSAKVTFIQAQVSLLKDVDRVTSTIKAEESTVDLLCVSQGYLSLAAHEATSEGVTTSLAVAYYSRILTMQKLLPLLNKSLDPRIVSILAPGGEELANPTDLGISDPKNYSMISSAKQGATMMSLTMRELSRENPKVSFIHEYPGSVDTGLFDTLKSSMTGWLTPLGWLASWCIFPIVRLFAASADDAGQRVENYLTDKKYSAHGGTNFYRLTADGEDVPPADNMTKYDEDGTAKRVMEHTQGVFDRALSQ